MAGEHLVAVCGLYCGACGLYCAWRDNDKEMLEQARQFMSSRQGREYTLKDLECDGCLANGRLTPYCRECQMRLCAKAKPGVTRCSDCSDFPCPTITAFNNDGLRHHAEVLDNIRHLREVGVEAWLKEQSERWRCPQCGASVDWYARTCFHCGATQPYRLPSLPRDKK
jgi:hypothetical protein